jgi:hypothetical protein
VSAPDPLRDPETGAYSAALFEDAAARELLRARRHGRCLSVASFQAPAGLARPLLAALARAVRDEDLLSTAGPGRFRVLLPETDAFGALAFLRRAEREADLEPALGAQPGGTVDLGAATFPADGAGLEALLGRCEARLAASRGSPARDLPPAAEGFWAALDRLAAAGAFRSARVAADDLEREVARGLARDPAGRALIYAGGGAAGRFQPLLAALPAAGGRAGDQGPRLFLLGPRAADGAEPRHPLATRVYLDADRRLARERFLLVLAGRAAYALWERGGEPLHLSDARAVSALATRLAAQYELAPA